MTRALWLLTGIAGFSGVALGAFGAHGLKPMFEATGELAQRSAWWSTGAHYHLAHALAIGLAASVVTQSNERSAMVAGLSFFVGILLFSGSLYALAFTGARSLGAVALLGGLCFLTGWVALAVAGYLR